MNGNCIGSLHGINILLFLFNSSLGFIDLHSKYIERYWNGRKASIDIFINNDDIRLEESTIEKKTNIFRNDFVKVSRMIKNEINNKLYRRNCVQNDGRNR